MKRPKEILSEAPDRFQIIQQLGKSQYATSYKAFDQRHHRYVVIKVLADRLYREPQLLRLIRQRIKQLAELRHPQIVPIIRAKEAANGFYWMMPYLGGGTLGDRIEAHLFTKEEVRTTTKQLADLLVYAHHHGIQHLNLKNSNVLFDEAGKLYLADFVYLPLAFQFKQIPDAPACREIDFASLRKMQRLAMTVAPTNAARKQWVELPEAVTEANTPLSMGQSSARRWRTRAFAILSICFLSLFLLGQFAPLIGARAAPVLRQWLGNERVAALETTLFRIQDRSAQIRVDLGVESPESPWDMPLQPQPTTTVAGALQPQLAVTATMAEVQTVETEVAASAEITPTIPMSAWQTLADVPPLGTLDGEGIWMPYLTAPNGDLVARRTFLHPDVERPLTIVGVVAFDLTQTRLNYVLGSQEPSRTDGPKGSGMIPAQDRDGGRLLATFNGGFMSTHGGFGAMQDDLVAVAPRRQLATVAIDSAGDVEIGAWGSGISAEIPWQAYRQNARLIIKNGAINPDVYNDSIADWGGTINSEIVTWRSAIGLNAERTILYYVAGPSISMPVLADSLLALGIDNGMLLDINPYWVHFAAIKTDERRISAEALFADEMSIHVDRYLRPSERDFFYMTTR